MNCPNCKNELKLKKCLVSESQDGVSTYTYQWWKCDKCKHVYFGELTEYISDGSYEHALYEAPDDIWRNDMKQVRKCPAPEDTTCTCPAHKENLLSHYTKRMNYSYEKE